MSKTAKEGQPFWGRYIFSDAGSSPSSSDSSTLRVALLGSYWRGLAISKALESLEGEDPSICQVVGFATDDIWDPKALISKAKRIWQYCSQEERESIQEALIEINAKRNVPVYTGPVKNPSYLDFMRSWLRPDVILMGTYGQLVSEDVFLFPRYGMYNFHPSDLGNGKYPGPNPFRYTWEDDAEITCMTMCYVDGGIDTGAPVGRSVDIATGIAELSKLDLDPEVIFDVWVKTMHFVTAEAAGVMADATVRKIHEQRKPLEQLDFSSFFDDEQRAYYLTAVPDLTKAALKEMELLTPGVNLCK